MKVKPVNKRVKSKYTLKKLVAEDGIPLLVIVPFAVLFFMFFHVPVIKGFIYSLTNWNGIDINYKFIGLDNYKNALTDERFWNSIIFTLKYSVIVSLLVNIIGFFIALLLNQKIKFRNTFRGIFFFPAVLSLLTIGYIFNNLYYYFFPSIGKALNITALQTNILGDEKLAMWGIIIVNVWQGIAMTIVVYLAGLQTVPISIYECARVEGANTRKILTNITLPLIIPSITINLILNIRGGLSVFDYIVALTGGGPGVATESIVLFIFSKGYSSTKIGFGSASSVILFIMFVLIAVTQIVYLRKREVEY
ncbi:MAG: sugar ABC transporter permease [Clostridia bacterium]|nr:sugar ABC transporter permease [Clostridia bacterium]